MFKHRNKIIASVFVVLTASILFVAAIPPVEAQPKFILSSWDYPDEYGQGIDFFEIYENSTGSWVNIEEDYGHDDSYSIDWDIGVFIKLRCWTTFNATLTWSESIDVGKLYQRHYVSVVDDLSETVFTQQNFTFGAGVIEGFYIYNYAYDVVLNFIPVTGRIYTVTVMYEIFW